MELIKSPALGPCQLAKSRPAASIKLILITQGLAGPAVKLGVAVQSGVWVGVGETVGLLLRVGDGVFEMNTV